MQTPRTHMLKHTDSQPALFLAVPLSSPDLHHSMNKAAEWWRKVSSTGGGLDGMRLDGGDETLANQEKMNEWIPPVWKWQFQFCQPTSPATKFPEAAVGKHWWWTRTHTHTVTAGDTGPWNGKIRKTHCAPDLTVDAHPTLIKSCQSSELLALNYWGQMSTDQPH